jgi:hypothetical protein
MLKVVNEYIAELVAFFTPDRKPTFFKFDFHFIQSFHHFAAQRLALLECTCLGRGISVSSG